MLLTIIAAGSVLTLATGSWSDWGWISRSETATFAKAAEYSAHVAASDNAFAAQKRMNEEISGSLNEIKALLTIVPQIKNLIRNRCDGGRGLDLTIEELKDRYRDLTGTEYREPSCGSPELLE